MHDYSGTLRVEGGVRVGYDPISALGLACDGMEHTATLW